MKKSAILFGGTLAIVLAVGPAFAQTGSGGSTGGSSGATTGSGMTGHTGSGSGTTGKTGSTDTGSSTTTAPAEKPGKLSMPHHVTGEVVSANTNSMTVKDTKGKEYTFMADTATAGQMANFKQGDHVKVTYKKSKGQMVATKIAEAQTTKAAK